MIGYHKARLPVQNTGAPAAVLPSLFTEGDQIDPVGIPAAAPTGAAGNPRRAPHERPCESKKSLTWFRASTALGSTVNWTRCRCPRRKRRFSNNAVMVPNTSDELRMGAMTAGISDTMPGAISAVMPADMASPMTKVRRASSIRAAMV